MIRINLLPTKRKKKAKPIPTFLVAGVVFLVISLAVSFFAMYFMNRWISDLEAQKKSNEQKLAQLQERMNEVKKFENLNRTFQQRKQIIEELTKNQSIPVRILDQVARSLTDGVWITGMNISGTGITIKGMGFSNPDIVTYVQSLKDMELFTEVVLHGTSRGAVEGVEVYNFSVSFKVKA
jgi:type IV pilus assembly protein PilN